MITVGIDVGGTFTDVFLRDSERQGWVVHKVPSTPPDFATGFMRGFEDILHQAGVTAKDCTRIIHGTTVGTNCILTQSGARLGLLLTEGFRDVLYIGVGWRPKMYDLDMDPVEPLFLAPRRRAMGVRERIDVSGKVLTPLDDEHLAAVAKQLVEKEGVEVFVVCYLHAYANPQHEQRTRDVLQGLYPDIPVTLSSDVLPRRREYRRLVVSGFDGYVKPAVTRYLAQLEDSLTAADASAPLHIMQSHGGVGGVQNVVERPVGTVLSGLAAGVIGAANVGDRAGHPNCISLDMGGTSTDVALIRDGRALITSEGSFEDYPLNLPMVDVRTIGAGGSSIAYVDQGGALKVGPESAGAMPGPACYGRGGVLPTVTDASLVLGYLNPDTFAGGLSIDVEKSRQAIDEHVAGPLGIDTAEAALGIHAIVNSNMAQTLRLVSIKRGHDPRDFTLIAFGGAGPLQGGRLAEQASIRKLLIPPTPGVLSAMGLMLAPIQHEGLASYEMPSDGATAEAIRDLFAPLDSACQKRMTRDGATANVERSYFAEMRYVGQSHQLEVELANELGDALVADAIDTFHVAHEQAYGHSNTTSATEFVALRCVHRRAADEESLLSSNQGGSGQTPKPGSRRVCLSAAEGYRDIPVYERASLPAGYEITGPALIEQADTTAMIYQRHVARVDTLGNIVVDVPADDGGTV